MTTRTMHVAARGLATVLAVTMFGACSDDDTSITSAPSTLAPTQVTSAIATSTVVDETATPTVPLMPPTTLPLGDPSTEVSTPVDVGTAPTPGTDAEGAVPVGTVVPLPSVPIDEVVTTPDGVEIDIVSVTRVDVTGQLPGEVSGPGYEVSVVVTNRSATPLDVSPIEANLTVGPAAEPRSRVSSASRPPSGELPQGGRATGTFVFSAPDTPSAVAVSITVVPGTSPAVFVGTV